MSEQKNTSSHGWNIHKGKPQQQERLSRLRDLLTQHEFEQLAAPSIPIQPLQMKLYLDKASVVADMALTTFTGQYFPEAIEEGAPYYLLIPASGQLKKAEVSLVEQLLQAEAPEVVSLFAMSDTLLAVEIDVTASSTSLEEQTNRVKQMLTDQYLLLKNFLARKNEAAVA